MGEVTDCDRCGADLAGCYCQIYGDGLDNPPTEVICMKCNLSSKLATWKATGVLNTSLIIAANLAHYDLEYGRPLRPSADFMSPADISRVCLQTAIINQAIGRFEQKVWFDGLQHYVQQAVVKGHATHVDGITVRLYAMAGRVIVTFEDAGGGSVTVITAEDETESVMGLQGVDTTVTRACGLLRKACDLHSEGQLHFQPETGVQVI